MEQTHDGCWYLGNDAWDCGHLDNGDGDCDCHVCTQDVIEVPQTRFATILLMRRVSQFLYDAGTSAEYSDGTDFIAALQASATVERLLRELEAE